MHIKNALVQIAVLIPVLFFFSCESKVALPKIDAIVFDEAQKDFKLTDRFNKFHFIQLEQTEECVFESIVKIIDTDECLIVMTNNKEVFCFERTSGKFHSKIGAKGEGPGEFLYAVDFIYNHAEKTIGIIDAYKNSVFYYDMNGVFMYQKGIPVNVALISCAELSMDGYLMMSNKLNDGIGSKDCAYTVVTPEGRYFDFDSFSPVYVEGYVTQFASRPMTVYGDGFTFQKFLNDTIFRMENGNIIPKYELSMKKQFLPKDLVAQAGPFDWADIFKISSSSGFFSGFNNIFETDKFILLEPMFADNEGYFWIDKETETGFRIPSTQNFSNELNLIIEGRSMTSVKGCKANELISCFQALFAKAGFVKQMDENPDLVPFSEEMRPFFENTDSDGNPVVIIYEH